MMEYSEKIGVLEYWSNGVLGFEISEAGWSDQHSITPPLQREAPV